MNDAVAITLFRTTGKFVGMSIGAEEFFTALVDFVLSFAGSVIIGYALGIFSAWIFKTVDMSHHRLVLVSVFVGMVYIPFFLAGLLLSLLLPPSSSHNRRGLPAERHRDHPLRSHHRPPILGPEHASRREESLRLRLRDPRLPLRDLCLPLHRTQRLLQGPLLPDFWPL
jgi:hypothetical protein